MRRMFPFVAFKAGQDFAKIDQVRITFDPYEYDIYNTAFGRAYQINRYVGQDALNTGLFEKEETHDLTTNGGINPVRPTGDALNRRLTQTSFTFKHESLSNYFGFPDKFNGTFPRSLFVFNGVNAFTPLQAQTNYAVELQNIPLESYDSLKKGRKNIIKYIPVLFPNPQDPLVINYETSNIEFLNLRNNKKQSLRNIKARILDNFGDPIKTNGYSSIVLMLDN